MRLMAKPQGYACYAAGTDIDGDWLHFRTRPGAVRRVLPPQRSVDRTKAPLRGVSVRTIIAWADRPLEHIQNESNIYRESTGSTNLDIQTCGSVE